MAKNRYEGDPKLYMSADGVYLKFEGGQPVMDAGLENRVAIPLFTRRLSKDSRKPWVGNIVFPDPAHHMGSDFEEGFSNPITLGMLEDVKQRGEKALQPMIDTGLASDLIFDVSNPNAYRIDISLRVLPPNVEITFVKNGTNWIVQGADPPEPDPPEPDPIEAGFGNYPFGNKPFGVGR